VSENTKLWDILGRTDPAHTKQFKRAGGFAGTAIKPMWAFRRMTEEFGACGSGWGVNEPSFQVVPGPEGEMLVFCTASVWYTRDGEERQSVVYGVGGDKVVGKNKYGLSSDDEAFKKAFTDAITNALKLIGVGADVHMGLFDDNKYVATMRQEFSDEPPPKSSASLKRAGSWEELKADLDNDFADCHSLVALTRLRETYRARAVESGWPKAWLSALANEFDGMQEALKKVEYAETI
jgi:hypothetical protein